MLIYLIRHGQTTGDVENRYGGDYDDHLTDLGQKQSKETAELLKDKKIEKLFTSPRLRALETATAIGHKLHIDPMPIDEFRERNSYGVLTGLTREEAGKKYPDQVAQLEGLNTKVEGSEEYAAFQNRITNALQIVTRQDSKVIAVVTHGGPIRLIFRDILRLGEINMGDCAYAILETDGQNFSLQEKNGIDLIT